MFFIDLRERGREEEREKEKCGLWGARGRERGRERQTDRRMDRQPLTGCLLYAPQLGMEPQPRCVP